MSPVPPFRRLWGAAVACATLAASPLAPASPGGANQRTFTRADGKQVTASIAGFDQGKAIVSLTNGKSAVLDPQQLSAEDRQWIDDWRARTLRLEAVFTKRRVEAKVVAKASASSDASSSSSQGGTSVKDKSSRTREQSWCYEIKLHNRSQTSSGPLRIEYRQFVQRREETNDSSGKSVNDSVQVLSGQKALDDLRRQAVATLTTDTQKLSSVTTYQKRDYGTTTDSTTYRLNDELDSIWIRVFDAGNRLVLEVRSPGNVARRPETKW